MDFSPFWVSIKTTFAATFITFFTGIFTAWLIANSKSKLKGFFDSIITIPMVLPPTVVGYILLLIFGKNTFIGAFLNSIGIKVAFTWTATVIAATVVSFPLMYKTARGAFEQMDVNLINAAKTLGAGNMKIFFKVVLPISWPGILAGVILAFARALGEFGATIMLAGNISGVTSTMPVSIYFLVSSGRDKDALIWVLIILAFSLFSMTAMNLWLDRQSKKYYGGKI
ncbi:MAG: molybdate ABC transporter permease subunit [Endomicrobium sp.]|jgi:molybdate transport system permease protein|nr:molybdate ABC transporter permease subunit [Endomicrobium sp.]